MEAALFSNMDMQTPNQYALAISSRIDWNEQDHLSIDKSSHVIDSYKTNYLTNCDHYFYHYRKQNKFIFENGQSMSCAELFQLGFGNWTSQIQQFGAQLKILIQDDYNAVWGLAALILVNYKPVNYRTPLLNSSEVYSLHHRFVEMLKSHCCSSNQHTNATSNSQTSLIIIDSTNHNTTNSNNNNNNSLKKTNRFITSDHHHVTSLPILRNDSTYFSIVFQQKDVIHEITRQFLIVPLKHLFESDQTTYSWLKDILEIIKLSD
ncbi:unnamed protein product [Schistosoma turkestanicum]|nr:unnamed protein product [Schistosoma turkestanicum]